MFKRTISLSFPVSLMFLAYFKNWVVTFFLFISGSCLSTREISFLPLM